MLVGVELPKNEKNERLATPLLVPLLFGDDDGLGDTLPLEATIPLLYDGDEEVIFVGLLDFLRVMTAIVVLVFARPANQLVPCGDVGDVAVGNGGVTDEARPN
jgi:hypothetical protein